MANFSNTLNSTTNPKATALKSKIAPNFVPEKTDIFNSGTPLGTLANIGANIGGGIKNLVNNGLGGNNSSSPLIPQNKNLASPIAATNQATPTTPTTPVKSTSTGSDGSTKTEYHAPQQTPPTSDTSTSFGQLVNKGVDSLNKSAILTGQIQSAKQDVAGNPNYSLDTQVGRQGLIQQNLGTQADALARQGSAYLSGASVASPQQYSIYSQPYNPLTDTYGGGGANGAVGRNIQASNIGSAGDLQTQVNNINSVKSQAENNFDTLISYGKQFDANTPILTGLKQLYAGTAGGDEKTQQAIAGFQSSLANIQQQYKDLTGADPASAGLTPNVTPAALAQIKQDMQAKVQNKLQNYNQSLNQLQGAGNTTNNSTGETVPIGNNVFTQDANGNWIVKK